MQTSGLLCQHLEVACSHPSLTYDNTNDSLFPRVTQILKGVLEGATRILPALRVLSSLLSSCSDSVLLYSFCREAGLPGLLLSLLRHSQESITIQQVGARSGASEDGHAVLPWPSVLKLMSLFGLTAFVFFALIFVGLMGGVSEVDNVHHYMSSGEHDKLEVTYGYSLS